MLNEIDGEIREPIRFSFRPPVLDDEILSLIRSTSFEEASGALAACWQGYLPDCAALLGARIREIPEEFWGSDPELLLALGSSHRAPPVSNPFAALAFMEAAETSLPARRSTARPDLEVLIALGRARALRGIGRLVDARAAVATARESLAPAARNRTAPARDREPSAR